MRRRYGPARNATSCIIRCRLEVFNLVVTYHNDAPEPVAGKPVSDDEVMQGFAHLHARAQAIIRHGKNWRSGCCAIVIPANAGSTAASPCLAMPRTR